MLLKIIVCCCYEDIFAEANHQQSSSIRSVICSCNENHKVFVLGCKSHVFTLDIGENRSCKCKYIDHNAICRFCVTIREENTLSFCKICSQKLPVQWSKIVVPLDVKLDKLTEMYMLDKTTDC